MTVDVMEGIIEAVAAPKDIGYQDRKGDPATFTKYSFKMGNDLWYETTSPNEALHLVRGEYIKFSFEEKVNGDFTNRRIKDIMSEAPENASQAAHGGERATQQATGAQPPATNWERRDISIKWGQAVNLAAQGVGQISVGDIKNDEDFEKMVAFYKVGVKGLADRIFPMLIAWEKEAVDAWLATVALQEILAPEEQKEAELQGQEVGQPTHPAILQPTQAKPQLPREPMDEPPMDEEPLQEDLPW